MRMRVQRGQRGLSLIEVTIMLLVLMLLTSVLAPSIFDFVQDAQWVKVKEDCEVLAISVARLVKDVGPQLVGAGPGIYPDHKLDLILSDGKAAIDGPAIVPGQPLHVMNWWIGGGANTYDPYAVNAGHSVATCEEQFIRNRDTQAPNGPFYTEAGAPPVGLTWGQGWRGAYLAPPCGPDPWGRAYQINTKWLTTRFDLNPGAQTVNHCLDVFCLSPGKNGIIETPFATGTFAGGTWTPPGGTFRGGDDWVTIITPCDP